MKLITTTMDGFGDAGMYSLATTEYAGLVTSSLVKRGASQVGKATKATARGINNAGKSTARGINKAGKYSVATVEFAGMVSVSVTKRSGSVVKAGALKVTLPVSRVVASPFVKAGNKAGKAIGKFRFGRRLNNVEAKIEVVNERLERIEKYGVRLAKAPAQDKKISPEQIAVLRSIVEENKDLLGDD